MRRTAAIVVASISFSLGGTVVAAELPSVARDLPGVVYPRLAVSVSAGVGLVFGNRCPAATSDAVGCPGASPVPELRLSPRWQATRAWAVGLSGGPLFVHNSDDTSTTWWDLQGEVRWHPFEPGGAGWWIAAAAGLVVAIDAAPAYTTDTGARRPPRTYDNVGPSATLATGVDFQVAPWLAIGPVVRGFFLGVKNGSDPGGPLYGSQSGALLGLAVTGMGLRR